MASESDWFHRIELLQGFVTPGWSDPVVEKFPYFGLPDDMTGMRVIDIGRTFFMASEFTARFDWQLRERRR